MSKSLISFIGTGRRKVEGALSTYDKTVYDFGDQQINTAMFFNAILSSNKYDISEALVIGTKTSAWGALLEEYADNKDYEDLYLNLEDVFDKKGVNEPLLEELEGALEKIWGKKIKCIATSDEINNNNAFDIIAAYFNEFSELANDELIIDITHGFRSMPILLMSALQLNENIESNIKSINLIYGEFNGAKSHVRELNAIWTSVEISRAVNNFFQKFDANELSELLDPFWKSGSKAIVKLGSSLQGNLLIWLDEPLKQLKNALNESTTNSPLWFNPVKKKIQLLYDQLNSNKTKTKLCFCIADMFAKRHIYGQAIIALQLAFEAFLFDLNEIDENLYGGYDKTKELSKEFFKRNDIDGKDKQKLRALSNTRNTIAHGGSRSTHGGKPQAQNLPMQYSSYKNLLSRIFDKFLT